MEYIKQNQRPELVRWEPSEGNIYAVLFSRLLEIFTVNDDEPLHQVNFDTNQASFDFIS